MTTGGSQDPRINEKARKHPKEFVPDEHHRRLRTRRPYQQAGAFGVTLQDTTPEGPPSGMRVAVSGIIVLAGLVLGLIGVVSREWVQALGGGLVGIGQLPFLLILLRQRRKLTHQPMPAGPRPGKEG